MKFFAILLALVLLGSGMWYLSSKDKSGESAELPLVNETGEAAIGNHEEAMEEPGDETSMEAGTDAGMEFPTADTNVQTFNLEGFNFGYNLSEIHVKVGDTVTINLTSTGGFHDWVVDEFGAATARVNTGETTSVTFVADKAGTYEYYCSVGSHRANGMVGTLIVE